MTKLNMTLCVEAENLKDILWYIRGMKDTAEKFGDNIPFNEEHIEALLVAIQILQKELKEGRNE